MNFIKKVFKFDEKIQIFYFNLFLNGESAKLYSNCYFPNYHFQIKIRIKVVEYKFF